jgi:hypothetical protein
LYCRDDRRSGSSESPLRAFKVMQREIGPLAQLEGVRLDRSRHEPPAAADYAGRALRICEEQRIAHWQAFALCADGWALAVSGESGKGLSYGLTANQYVLLALKADALLAIGKPEEVLASVAAGLKEKTGARCLKPSSIGSGARHCSPAPGR